VGVWRKGRSGEISEPVGKNLSENRRLPTKKGIAFDQKTASLRQIRDSYDLDLVGREPVPLFSLKSLKKRLGREKAIPRIVPETQRTPY
jgi:hypothetical protein